VHYGGRPRTADKGNGVLSDSRPSGPSYGDPELTCEHEEEL